MAKRKTSNLPHNDFACEDDLDVCGFTSEPITTGECISSFSFDDESSAENTIDIKSDSESIKYINTNSNEADNFVAITPCPNNHQTISTSTNINTANSDNVLESNPKNNLINNTVILNNQNIQSKNTISEDNRNSPIVNGIAPPINGEYLDVKRTYMLRASTVRKINELKSIHPELNTYVSTIVDIAINYYYKHIVHEGGTQ